MKSTILFEECNTEEEFLKVKQKHKLTLNWEIPFLKIFINDELIGLIEYDILKTDESSILYIYNFEVLKKNNGYGKKIVSEILKVADDNKLDIYLHSNNKKAEVFWNNMGFKTVDDGTGTPCEYYSHS